MNRLKLHKRVLLVMLVGIGQVSPGVAQESKTALDTQITKEMMQQIASQNHQYYKEGKVADYIPELGKANAKAVAFSVVKENGEIINVGDVEAKFTIQSISKVIALMIAVQEKGEKALYERIGYYGTEKAFNHYANLETAGKPLNPMMNAGAILTTAFIEGEGDVAYQKILKMIRYITKNESIDINQAVYLSEKETGHRNRGIFYLLKNNGLIEGEETKLDNYFKQCSIEVTAEDLAKIGYFYANGCTRFDGDTTYYNRDLARLIQAQMLIAGMYDFSGEYARTVGLPSKSGVGGGIAVSVPNKIGIGVFNPALDEHGNSVVGYHMLYDFVNQLELSLF
ncbi:glutaminase A [Myroides sp. DF42-4-2]|uniref:glutaminase A n=1 Tax=unclassified Myroides TaxID=2642485 RepID=UPI00257708AC|nr:glutaminase A [Myroides sp. DF42-4-2]MDM1407295.1 glutaminase A [Myroides sp. DF42-4-2]